MRGQGLFCHCLTACVIYYFHEFYNSRNQIQEKEEEKEIADQDLIDGKKVMSELQAKREQLLEYDKSFEKNFKKEFPGLGFNQLESLMKSFKYAIQKHKVDFRSR